MGIYTIKHGYQKKRRWPYFMLAIFLITTITSFVVKPFKAEQVQTQAVTAQLSNPAVTAPAPQLKISTPLPWPSYGQAAYGVTDDGVLAQSNETEELVPVASLAKTITALAILKQKPLAVGDQGPIITLTEEDEALYREYVAKSGTVIPVKTGTQISQYQALQAMLMVSSNNISDTLVRWAFGSVGGYNIYANEMLKELGITQTIVADASGYSSLTKSTASDMVRIGMLYMQHPVLQEIALQPKATVPFAGVIYNNNSTINKDGVIGIKIGFTEEAGKTFLVADVSNENDDEISVAVVLGADKMSTAMQDAKRLLKSGNLEHALLSEKRP